MKGVDEYKHFRGDTSNMIEYVKANANTVFTEGKKARTAASEDKYTVAKKFSFNTQL